MMVYKYRLTDPDSGKVLYSHQMQFYLLQRQ